MEIEYSPSALRDIEQWKRSGDRKTMDRITELLKSVKVDYKSGIGKPEPHKGDMLGHWSRRIDKKNRLVYCVYEEEQIITVISLRGHYSDK